VQLWSRDAPHCAGAPSKEPRVAWHHQQQLSQQQQRTHSWLGNAISRSQRHDAPGWVKPPEGRNEVIRAHARLVPSARRRTHAAGVGKDAVSTKATQAVQKLQMSKRSDLRAGGTHKSKGMAMAEARLHHSLVARLQKAPEVCFMKLGSCLSTLLTVWLTLTIRYIEKEQACVIGCNTLYLSQSCACSHASYMSLVHSHTNPLQVTVALGAPKPLPQAPGASRAAQLAHTAILSMLPGHKGAKPTRVRPACRQPSDNSAGCGVIPDTVERDRSTEGGISFSLQAVEARRKLVFDISESVHPLPLPLLNDIACVHPQTAAIHLVIDCPRKECLMVASSGPRALWCHESYTP
jgi:hypothetical protein